MQRLRVGAVRGEELHDALDEHAGLAAAGAGAHGQISAAVQRVTLGLVESRECRRDEHRSILEANAILVGRFFKPARIERIGPT